MYKMRTTTQSERNHIWASTFFESHSFWFAAKSIGTNCLSMPSKLNADECWCHCHSLSLASVKSRSVLPFWYRLTRVVLDKGPLNGCVYYYLLLLLFWTPMHWSRWTVWVVRATPCRAWLTDWQPADAAGASCQSSVAHRPVRRPAVPADDQGSSAPSRSSHWHTRHRTTAVRPHHDSIRFTNSFGLVGVEFNAPLDTI